MHPPPILTALLLGIALTVSWPARAQTERSGQLLLCSGCHGMNGEGRAGSGYPRIAGQSAAYIERQLEGYASGLRRSPVMEPLARALSGEERRAISAHFSKLHAPNPSAARIPAFAPVAHQPERGEMLARFGDDGVRVQACQNCHGALGRGHPPYNPYLAGLDKEYLRNELTAWKSGARRTDPSGNMQVIARNLNDSDIDAVSSYYAGLPPPAP